MAVRCRFTIPDKWLAPQQLSNKKRQSPVRGSARSIALSADNIFAFVVEALPFSVPSNLAVGTGDAFVNEVSQSNKRQCRSNHGAPSFQLSRHIDSWITAQMLIFVFTLEVSFAGVNVSLIIVFPVILISVLGHIITSLVDCFVFGVPSCLVKIYGRMENGQCEPVGGLVVGGSYHYELVA